MSTINEAIHELNQKKKVNETWRPDLESDAEYARKIEDYQVDVDQLLSTPLSQLKGKEVIICLGWWYSGWGIRAYINDNDTVTVYDSAYNATQGSTYYDIDSDITLGEFVCDRDLITPEQLQNLRKTDLKMALVGDPETIDKAWYNFMIQGTNYGHGRSKYESLKRVNEASGTEKATSSSDFWGAYRQAKKLLKDIDDAEATIQDDSKRSKAFRDLLAEFSDVSKEVVTKGNKMLDIWTSKDESLKQVNEAASANVAELASKWQSNLRAVKDLLKKIDEVDGQVEPTKKLIDEFEEVAKDLCSDGRKMLDKWPKNN